MTIGWLGALTAVAIMALGSALQAAVGIGLALFVVPVLALIDPAYIPGPMLLAGTVLAAMTAWRERHAVDRPGLCLSLAGLLVGAIVGAVTLKAFWGPSSAQSFRSPGPARRFSQHFWSSDKGHRDVPERGGRRSRHYGDDGRHPWSAHCARLSERGTGGRSCHAGCVFCRGLSGLRCRACGRWALRLVRTHTCRDPAAWRRDGARRCTLHCSLHQSKPPQVGDLDRLICLRRDIARAVNCVNQSNAYGPCRSVYEKLECRDAGGRRDKCGDICAVHWLVICANGPFARFRRRGGWPACPRRKPPECCEPGPHFYFAWGCFRYFVSRHLRCTATHPGLTAPGSGRPGKFQEILKKATTRHGR